MTVRKILIGDDASTWLPWALRFLAHVKRFTPESTPWTKNVTPASDVLVSVKHTPSGDTVAVSACGTGEVVGFCPVTADGWVTPHTLPVFCTLKLSDDGRIVPTVSGMKNFGIKHTYATGHLLPLSCVVDGEGIALGRHGSGLVGRLTSNDAGELIVVPGGAGGVANEKILDPSAGGWKQKFKVDAHTTLHVERPAVYKHAVEAPRAWLSVDGVANEKWPLPYYKFPYNTLPNDFAGCTPMGCDCRDEAFIPFPPTATATDPDGRGWNPKIDGVRLIARSGAVVEEDVVFKTTDVVPGRYGGYLGGGKVGSVPSDRKTTSISLRRGYEAAGHIGDACASLVGDTTKREIYVCGAKVKELNASTIKHTVIMSGGRDEAYTTVTLANEAGPCPRHSGRTATASYSCSVLVPHVGTSTQTAHDGFVDVLGNLRCYRTGAWVVLLMYAEHTHSGADTPYKASAWVVFEDKVYNLPHVTSMYNLDGSVPAVRGALPKSEIGPVTADGGVDVPLSLPSGGICPECNPTVTVSGFGDFSYSASMPPEQVASLAKEKYLGSLKSASVPDVVLSTDASLESDTRDPRRGVECRNEVRGQLFGKGDNRILSIGVQFQSYRPFGAAIHLSTGAVYSLKDVFGVGSEVYPATTEHREGSVAKQAFQVCNINGQV